MRSRLVRAAVIASIALLGTVCSLIPKNLDTKGLEPQLAQQIDTQFKITGVKVVCPDGIKAQAGGTFECIATLSTGDTMTINVTQTDGGGHVTWVPVGVSTPTPSP